MRLNNQGEKVKEGEVIIYLLSRKQEQYIKTERDLHANMY